MPTQNIRKVSSLAQIANLPNAAGIGSLYGQPYLNADGTPRLIGGAVHGAEKMFFVDQMSGSDTNDGKSWGSAKATIMAALNLARYDATGTLIYTDKNREAWVFVAPGHYDEQVLFSGYNIHLIGCGVTPGKDWGPCLNYSAGLGTPCVLGFSGSGIEVAGFYIESHLAFPGIWIAGGDNNWLHDCEVADLDGTPTNTYGIKASSMKGSVIERCKITAFKTAGIYLAGGANVFAINGRIRDCQLHAATNPGAKGIYAESTITAYNFLVERNFINVRGGGATGKGIDLDCLGISVVDNYVFVADTATAIENADTLNLHNFSNDTDTVVDPNPAKT